MLEVQQLLFSIIIMSNNIGLVLFFIFVDSLIKNCNSINKLTFKTLNLEEILENKLSCVTYVVPQSLKDQQLHNGQLTFLMKLKTWLKIVSGKYQLSKAFFSRVPQNYY